MPQGEFISPEEVKSVRRGFPGQAKAGWGMEQNQLKDGSIKVPEVLQKYLGGMEIISRKK